MRVAVGGVEEFEPGTMRAVDVDGRSIGIVNTGERLYAVLNLCPHDLLRICIGEVSGKRLRLAPGQPDDGSERHVLRCPFHGWDFDLADGGRCLLAWEPARLQLYPVDVEGGRVVIEVR